MRLVDYSTDDHEERYVTLALNDLFVSMTENCLCEDPLNLIARCLVCNIPAIQFAYCSYIDEEVGNFPAVRPGVKVFKVPPDVERKIVAMLRRSTQGGEIAVIPTERALSVLTPAMRKRWKPHLCIAADIYVEGRPIALLSIYLKPDFVINERHRGWFSLFRNASSALLTQMAMFRRVQSARNEDIINRNRTLDAWVNVGLEDPRIKAFVGIRGSRKTTMLQAVRSRVLSSGVPESRVCLIDFENTRTRKFRSASDLMNYLDGFSESKQPGYLFLNEVGTDPWHVELLRRLQRERRWNVWLSTSTLHALSSFTDESGRSSLAIYRTWADPGVPRSMDDLEKIWCKIFMRDVGAGFEHPDIRAKESLAEYYSDHLGESRSLREISKDFSQAARPLSSGSIRTFRQALVDAQLIEFSPIYDMFERTVVTTLSGRAFYTDLELREWRFGSAPDDETHRLALNRLYLELRRKHGEVYTPRDNEADFVTLDASRHPVLWRLPS